MANRNPFGWQAHIEGDLMRDASRLYLWREAGDGLTQLVVETELVTTTTPSDTAFPSAGILLPSGMGDAITEALRPRHDAAAEIKRLDEALALERTRVDRILFGRLDK